MDVIFTSPVPVGSVPGMGSVLTVTLIVLVGWPGFEPPAMTIRLTFDGQLSIVAHWSVQQQWSWLGLQERSRLA